MLRLTWERLVRKQWLILYPLALGIINDLAFLAVYAAGGERLRWNDFFRANFTRWAYADEHFVSGLSWSPALGVAIFAAFAACAFAALIRAPLFRAIAGRGYPMAPAHPLEALNLFALYVLTGLLFTVLPLVLPAVPFLTELVQFLLFLVAIVIVFADYIIVFERLNFIDALRRSVKFVARRWISVVVIVLIVQLISFGLYQLFESYYEKANGIFILLPLSELLVWAVLTLIVDLVLIFFYQRIRRGDG